ncbi:AAA family ATPase [Sorangium sp. So ce131]|uniref:AAA family ATPase n=1 Tax=Sorangium sp. So ce131 TaxID=3133282 RepID=UPI003F6220DD
MHRFVNFKGFADSQINLFNPVTLLIGKNGSGKTNAIEGVELLAEIAHGRPLYEISDIGRSGGFEVRGGLAGCVRTGSEMFQLGFSGVIHFEGSDQPFAYLVGVRAIPEPRIATEELRLGDRTLFTTLEGSEGLKAGVLKVRYDNFSRGGNKPSVTLPADRSILSQYPTFASSDKLKGAVNVAIRVRTYLRSSFVFDPSSKDMRQYDRIGNRVLTRHSANISPVLYALHQGNDEDKASLARILGWIKQLPEEPYEKFDFVTTELNDVLFGLRERPDGPLVDARLLSDGTLRCLGVLTALETVTAPSRVVIEEFDNGLHPSRTGVLAGAIWEASARRKLNVLCTTHNPATLDALTPEQLEGVVVAYWDKAQQASRLIPLLELPRADVLLERGNLGDLVTRRILEQHLMPGFEEKQQEEARAWLNSLP